MKNACTTLIVALLVPTLVQADDPFVGHMGRRRSRR